MLHFPNYRPASAGPWTLRTATLAGSRGYWGELTGPAVNVPILVGPGGGGPHSWMSTLPSETESQEIGLHAAHGHTVVCGLGMGWLAANLALREQVDRVSVIERDKDILSIVAACGAFDDLPPAARGKIAVIEADALTWRPDSPVDSLQIDIWLRYVEPQKLDDARRIQENVQAGSVYFWGQELEIWRHACRRAGGVPALDWPLVRQVVEEDLSLPLILPDWPDYPEKIAAAARWWAPKTDDWWRVEQSA